jgi:hypothetical protein
VSLTTTIDAMLAAGCSAEQLAAVVKAHEAERELAQINRRANDAERQRRSRMSRNVTVTECDSHGQKAPPFSPLSPTPPIPPITPPKSTPQARGTRLPDDWEPSQADLDFALNRGWQMEHVRIEAMKFRNWWTGKPGKDGLKLNWHRTWQNWCLNAFPSKSTAQPQQRKQHPNHGLIQAFAEIAARDPSNPDYQHASGNRLQDFSDSGPSDTGQVVTFRR